MFTVVQVEQDSRIYMIFKKNQIKDKDLKYLNLYDLKTLPFDVYGVLRVCGDKYESSYISYINVSIKVSQYLSKLSDIVKRDYFGVN